MEKSITEQINAISIDDWQKLFALIHTIENSRDFGQFKGGEKLADNTFLLNYMQPTQIVSDFIKTVYDIRLIFSNFHWMEWKEGANLLANPGTDYTALDLITLCKLITAIIRNDRFCEGYLVSQLKNGNVLKILKSINRQIMSDS